MSPNNNMTDFDYCQDLLAQCSANGTCENIGSLCREAVKMDRLDMDSTIIVAFMGFSILVYDHIITLNDEIEHIWKKPKGTLGYLFLLNRYLMPLGFIVNLYAYQRPNWPTSMYSCRTFVRYEGFMNAWGINVASFMMLLRIRALYNRNKWVVGFVGSILAVEFGINMGLLVTATSVPHLVPHASCSMIFTVKDTVLSSGSAWLPLLYDTVIFILLFYRTIGIRRENPLAAGNHIMRVLWEEGLMYYCVICTVAVVLTIMINVAEKGVQNITAQLELLLTVAMMSRITLDLKIRSKRRIVSYGDPHRPSTFTTPAAVSDIIFQFPPGQNNNNNINNNNNNNTPAQIDTLEFKQMESIHQNISYTQHMSTGGGDDDGGEGEGFATKPAPIVGWKDEEALMCMTSNPQQHQVHSWSEARDEWIELAGSQPPSGNKKR